MKFYGGVRILFILLLGSTAAQAGWQTEPFLKSFERNGEIYSFEFWVRGLDSVNKVSFNNDSTAQFKPFWNSMVLGDSHNDGANRIRAWQRLSSIDLGTLAHESFHAYIHNFIFREKDWRREKEWVTGRAPVLFYDLPESKALVALEEAYATFIGNTVTAARTLEMILSRKNSPNCEGTYALLKNIWERSWDDKVVGYYYRDSVTEYWSDRIKWVSHQITGSNEEVRMGEPIFTERGITVIDKDWISRHIFEEKWTADFDQSFPEISADLQDCVEEEETAENQSS